MHELLTASQMREADARTIAAGTAGRELMERAGRAVAEAARRHAPRSGRVLVACGPGNNGGDGFVAARLLRERGFRVTLALLGSRDRLAGDAALAAADWSGSVAAAGDVDPLACDVVVDALFGSGLSRALDGEAAQVVERINGSGRPVVAVDIPSGIDSDTGQVRGVAVAASETVTFARLKPGHLLMPGRRHCGRVTLADIGITDATIAAVGPSIHANEPELWGMAFPQPGIDAHKYERGHTLVLSGEASRTGAARLAARGALRIGSGLVTVASPAGALAENAAHLTAIMLRPCDDPEALAALLEDRRFNALVLGPGLGAGARTLAMVRTASAARRRMVLDADALTSFEGIAATLPNLLGAEASERVVLTPHAGEFARLFRGMEQVLEAPSKLERARRAARAVRGVVVFKGADTVIAAPDGRAAISARTTPYLATAGSGDVLAGMVAGLLAQGMPAFEAACAGAWLHAEAGRAAGPGLVAEDLPDLLPQALRLLPRR